MDFNAIKTETNQKTDATIGVLKNELAGLRTSRASVNLLAGIRVDAYGAEMPIDQVASVSVPENSVLVVSVWDAGLSAAVEKAIRDSSLGLNPQTAGSTIRLNLPPLTEERRKELVKVANGYAENAKIAVRNIRQEFMNQIKKAEGDKLISEDDRKRYEQDLQKIIDEKNAEIDNIKSAKEKDIMSV